MKFELVKLKDICKTTSGGTPSRNIPAYYQNGNIPWVKSGELQDGPIFQTEEKITEAAVAASSAKVFPAATLLIALYGATVGRLATLRVDAATNQAICAIFTSESIDRDFLFYYLLKQREHLIDSRTGGAQPNISQDTIRNLDIPLPPLDQQKRIATILGKADRLRRLRRYARELSDGYLQAVFVEMFGEPVSNPRGWPTTLLGKVASVQRGKFSPRPRNDPKYYGGDYPFIQTGDIAKSNGFLRHWTQTLNKEGTRVSRAFDVGTVVIAIVGATIGETAILALRAYCPDSVIGIQVNPKAGTSEYIEYMLRFWKPIFKAMAPETARANINLETLRPLSIPLPPLPLQQKFAQIVQKYERLRAQQREAEREAEHLFQSLLQRAFGGELIPNDEAVYV